MGLVFQDYALFENMTVRQNIRYALRFHPQLRAQADERTDSLLRRQKALERFFRPSEDA